MTEAEKIKGFFFALVLKDLTKNGHLTKFGPFVTKEEAIAFYTQQATKPWTDTRLPETDPKRRRYFKRDGPLEHMYPVKGLVVLALSVKKIYHPWRSFSALKDALRKNVSMMTIV